MNDKVADFQTALRKFQDLTSADNRGMLALSNRHLKLRRRLPATKCPSAGEKDWINRRAIWQEEADKLYNEVSKKDGVAMGNPSIFCYLNHAIEMYEQRQDQFKGQTGLLFSPASWHIQSIRFLIHLVKDSAVKSPQTSLVYSTMVQVEEALNQVQQSCHIPKTVKRDGAQLTVDGYGSKLSGAGIPVDDLGVVIRQYGSGRNLRTIIEMRPESVISNVLELNLLGSSMKGITDIAVINRRGEVARFNCRGCGNWMGPLTESLRKTHLPGLELHGVRTTFAPAQLATIETTIIPMLVDARPPQVRLPVRSL